MNRYSEDHDDDDDDDDDDNDDDDDHNNDNNNNNRKMVSVASRRCSLTISLSPSLRLCSIMLY